MGPHDLRTVGEVAQRSGFATSALRCYEREGLVTASRTAGGQRRYARHVLRRLAFSRAARNIGLSLEEVRDALARLPGGRTPAHGGRRGAGQVTWRYFRTDRTLKTTSITSIQSSEIVSGRPRLPWPVSMTRTASQVGVTGVALANA